MPKSKSAHTPGPWVISRSKGLEIFPNNQGEYLPIAKVRIQDDIESSYANAALIAAAPELLEACKASLEYMLDEASSPLKAERALEYLSAAIAKCEVK